MIMAGMILSGTVSGIKKYCGCCKKIQPQSLKKGGNLQEPNSPLLRAQSPTLPYKRQDGMEMRGELNKLTFHEMEFPDFKIF